MPHRDKKIKKRDRPVIRRKEKKEAKKAIQIIPLYDILDVVSDHENEETANREIGF